MATALKQLKEMEERVKGVPALEKEVAKLRAEKDMLLLALQEKKASLEAALQRQPSTESSTQTTESLQSDQSIHSRLTAPSSPGHKGLGKSVELKKLTEKFEGREEKVLDPSSKVTDKPPVKVPAVETKSVAVGGDIPMNCVVMFYSQGVKDASEGTSVNVCEKGTETEDPVFHEEGTQVTVQTEDAEVWVMESLLGLTSEAQREIDTLQDTIKFQQESIVALEDRLSVADKDFEIFKAKMEEKTSKVTFDKGTLAKPDTKHAGTGTLMLVLQDTATSCHPEVSDACVGESLTADQTEQSTQTDAAEETIKPAAAAAAVVVSTGCQWENLLEEKMEEQKVALPKKRQLTIAEYKVSPEEEVISATEEKMEDERGENVAAVSTKTGEKSDKVTQCLRCKGSSTFFKKFNLQQ